MPNIFDNITDETRLGSALRSSLEDFDTADIASGYLDLRGWSNFADIIDAKIQDEGRAAGPIARVPGGLVAPADSPEKPAPTPTAC